MENIASGIGDIAALKDTVGADDRLLDNYNNTAYDLELATFGVTRTGITHLETTFEKITGAWMMASSSGVTLPPRKVFNTMLLAIAAPPATRTYYLHPDLGYDTYDRDRITPVVCELQAVQHEEGSSFESAAIRAAHDKFIIPKPWDTWRTLPLA